MGVRDNTTAPSTRPASMTGMATNTLTPVSRLAD